VKSALFGQLGLSLSLGPGGSADLDPTETSLGDRVVTRTANTSISAVATLRWEYPERLELVLYHNPFARNPLARGAAQTVGIEERWFEVI
jgi:hypothetical protein